MLREIILADQESLEILISAFFIGFFLGSIIVHIVHCYIDAHTESIRKKNESNT